MLDKSLYIVGIDTSCDDTSVGILKMDTKEVVANVVSSQIEVHAPHGGIVPELASRSHLENISLVFDAAIKKAGIALDEIGAIAVTKAPGLIGCLLVGTSFAKSLAYRLGVPLYGVNHLEGHLFSPFILGDRDNVFPFLGLVVSGGHTAFYRVSSAETIEIVGQTVDDAAGEAFDKCAKMLGLGYPGGPVVDKRAQRGSDESFPFTIARVKMGREYLSFSGLKTAAYHHISKQNILKDDVIDDICASLQKGIVDSLCKKLEYFLKTSPYQIFALSGGVAMNSLLRQRVREVCEKHDVACYVAESQYCTDNGAMIAHAALIKNCQDEVFTLDTQPSRKIQARQLKHEASDSRKS